MEPDLFLSVQLNAELEQLFGSKVDLIRYWKRINHYLKQHIDKEALYCMTKSGFLNNSYRLSMLRETGRIAVKVINLYRKVLGRMKNGENRHGVLANRINNKVRTIGKKKFTSARQTTGFAAFRIC